jgi:hypothetical protein
MSLLRTVSMPSHPPPSVPVRAPRRPEPVAHGRIADDGSPESSLEARTRWSAPDDSGRSDGL